MFACQIENYGPDKIGLDHSLGIREGVKKNNYVFSSLLLLRGPAIPPPLSSPVDNLDFRSIF